MVSINREKLDIMKEQIINFLYENEYPEYIKENFLKNMYDPQRIGCELYQVYSKFGVVDEEKDMYKYFYSLLKKYKFLNTNCCEVAAGYYPRLAELVYPTLKANNKTLTIYEPDIISKCLFEIKKELFTMDTDLTKVDTLYGTLTCDATIDIVEKALTEDKNLLIGLCECDHSTEKYPAMSQYYFNLKINNLIKKGITSIKIDDLPKTYWYESFCDILKKEYKDEISLLFYPECYDYSAPILLRMTEEHKRMHFKK